MEQKSYQITQVENVRLRQRMNELEHTVNHLTAQLTQAHQQLQHATRAEEALRTSEKRFRTLIEHNADAIIVTSDGIVRFVNPAAVMLFRRSVDELLGKELGIPIVAGDKAEVDILDSYGQRLVADMRVVEITWEGEPAHLASFRDITERKQMEEQLEQRVQERTAMLQHALHQLSNELAEREKTEKAILRRDAILEAIEFAAHRFLKNTCFEQEIPVVLEYVGNATLASRVALFAVQEDVHIELFTHIIIPSRADNNTEDPPSDDSTPNHLGNPGMRHFSRWKEQLCRGFSLHGEVRTFPPDERTLLEHEHVCSLVVVPIFVEQQWWGFIEFDEWRSGRSWLLAEVEALRAAASMIGTAIQHERVLQALRHSEERFRMVADFTYGWEYWMGPEGDYIYVSPSCERMTGYRPEEFHRDPALLEKMSHPDDRARVATHLQEHLPSSRADSIQFRILTRHGEERWIGHVCQPVYSSDDRWLGRRGSNRDITEQVRAEEALKREQRLFVGGPVVVFKWLASESLPVEYVSPNVIQFGYQVEAFTRGEVMYASLIDPQDQERVRAEMQAYAESDVNWFEQDYRILHADGTTRWVYTFTRIIRDDYGDITHYDGYVLDMTDRKQAEERMRQSEERFRAFVEGIDDLVLQLDETGHIVYINDVAERLLGMAIEKCIGKSLFDFVHPNDRQRTQRAFEGWIQNRATRVTFENRLVSHSGAVRTMHWAINLRYHTSGTTLTISTINGIARDMTEYKRVEQVLRESESRYRTISELVSDFAYALRIEQDGSLVLEWVTDAFAHITGFSLQEIERRGGWESLIYPSDLPIVKQSQQSLLAGQQSDEYEVRIMTRQNTMRWLRNRSRPVWDKGQGRVARIYGGMQDVTEWKQAMEALQESEQKFHRFFEQIQTGLLVMNDHGYVVECNQGVERLLGLKLFDLMGLSLWDILFDLMPAQQGNAEVYEQLKTTVLDSMHKDLNAPVKQVVQDIQCSNGTQRSLETLIFPIQTDKGFLFGGIMRDRAER